MLRRIGFPSRETEINTVFVGLFGRADLLTNGVSIKKCNYSVHRQLGKHVYFVVFVNMK